MAVNYEKRLNILAESFKQVFGEMVKKQTESYVVKTSKESGGHAYALGVAVLYENERDQMAGKFRIGLTDKKKAARVASAITDNTGPAISQFDEKAADRLYAFMHKAVGQAIPAWEQLEPETEFSTPLMLGSKKIEKAVDTIRKNYILTLRVSGESMAMFITFEEALENVLKGKKVLVVDDSGIIRKVLRRDLEKQGCLVIEAADGQEGVDIFSKRQPDLTIMDMVMPRMDGFEAIGQLRKTAPHAKVIMLTSTSGKNDVLNAASLGIRMYVKKPIKSEKLIEVARACFK